jgi:comEA protein
VALFTRRDRIAITCIAALILIGWGFRYIVHRREEPRELKVIRNAVKPPAELMSEGKQFTSPVNINTAGKEELEILPMIGTVKAEAIISYRNKNGHFNTISDIKKVHGIGPATYEKIKSNITINSETPVKKE